MMVFYVLASLAFLLPVSHGILHPSRCGKLTYVVIDVHEASYTIPFTACDGNALGCSCQNPDEDLVITNAYLSSDNAVYNLSHEAETIDVTLPEPNMSVGIYKYKVGCNYECVFHFPFHVCEGKCEEMELVVEVVDFEIKVKDSELIDVELLSAGGRAENIKVLNGSDVTVTCSSGLGYIANSSDLPTIFAFTAQGDTNITKYMECGQDNTLMNDGDWIIARQNSPPYDCLLTLINFDQNDVGKYLCAAFLPRDNSVYEDWSKSSVSLSMKEPEPPSGPETNNIIIIILVVSIAIPVSFMLLVLFGLVYRVRKHRGLIVTPATSLTSHRSLRQNYGSTDHGMTPVEISLTDSVERTLVPSDASALFNGHGSPTIDNTITPHTVVEVTLDDPPLSVPAPSSPHDPEADNESNSLDKNTSNSNTGPLLLLPESDLESSRSRGSTISEGQQGINYYQEHTDIDRPDGRVTPEGGAVPFDENYKCTYCGKRYRKNQRLYYTRHMEELEQRCPKYVQSQSTADPKDNNDLSVICIPSIGSNLTVPDICLPKPKEHPETTDSDVGSLEFLAESSSSSSNSGPPSTELSTSSSGPPSSVGEEGQQMYNKVMDLKPALGDTPDSHFPINPHYTCPNCGKEYHNDQRMYLVRHVNEQRCVHCVACSDSGSEQKSSDSG